MNKNKKLMEGPLLLNEVQINMATPCSAANFNLKLAPSEKISKELCLFLNQINAARLNFPTYTQRVRNLFNLEKVTINENRLYFLAGFIEGEGSFSISIKKNTNAKFGVELDPVFNITQHINGVNNLYLALEVFQAGRIRYKTGSNATLVFVIEPRQSLREKVCPYYETYVYGFSSPSKQIRYNNFKKLLQLFDKQAHLHRDRFLNEMLPIWDSMRMQKGYEGQTFKSLEEAQQFVRNFVKPKKQIL